jgi:hypothetical protein
MLENVISLHFNNLYPLLNPSRLPQLTSCHPADYHGLCKPAVDFVEQVPVTRNLSYGCVVQLLLDFNYQVRRRGMENRLNFQRLASRNSEFSDQFVAFLNISPY